FQVHFYHQHYNHSTPGYKLSEKYKKYSISSFMKRAADYKNLAQLKQDDADLYMQFKALMEGIIVDAAKINIATLKVLVGKALEITAILTNYDEELDDISTVASKPKPRMSDVEISKLLEEPNTKRKVTEATKSGHATDASLAKRKKIEVPTNIVSIPNERHITIDINEVAESSSPKILNSFSLAETHINSRPIRTIAEKSTQESEIEVVEENKSKANGVDVPSSFNDSYKDFVVKNFPIMESVASRTRSKPVVKTRIGQFKPNVTKMDDTPKLLTTPTRNVEEKTKLVPRLTKIVDNTPKLIQRMSKAVEENVGLGPRMAKIVQDSPKLVPKKTVEDILVTETAKTMDDTSKLILKTTGIVVDSPKLVAGRAKNLEDKNNTSKVINKKDNKTQIQIIERQQTDSDNETPKTKQIKKVYTPKAKTVTRNYSVSSTTSFDKPKVDFDYEVKERADDCNILILKF
ncbi:jg27867, partial [Pararge aegeria aegeria]